MITMEQQGRRGRWAGWVLSQLLALAFFAACLWWVAREADFVFANDRILASLSLQEQLGSALAWQLATFAAVAWLIHAVLGFLALALARLTEAAFPRGLAARREWLIAGWFTLLAGLAFAANTTFHPSSLFAGEESWWRREIVGFPPLQVAAAAVGLLIASLALRAVPRLALPKPKATVPACAIVLLAIAVLTPPRMLEASNRNAWEAPHVMIVGIDSLRNDLTIPKRGPAAAPGIRRFLREARRFNDATSPLPRTYGAWVSILTGRHPVNTNARVNLMPRKLVREGETLAGALQARGYRTVYATDEVRFANFDESFGFDELITPPVGAVDFLLGYAGDIPLVNLVVSTPVGGLLFPSNHANRGAHATYRPQHFLRRLDGEFSLEGPTFLAVHLTLAHWPYSWAGMPAPSRPDEYRDAYRVAVAEVDRQFDGVMRMLADKGVLDNAIVVLLSDHGEALGAESDSMLRETGTSREIWDSLWGHGTSVMSPHQYQVVLAMRAYGQASLPGPPQDYDWPVSLEDLRPTLEQFATGLAPTGVDGVSLIPYMTDPARAETLQPRIRFTETDFNTPNTLAGRYEASGLIDEAAVYYELDRDNGWVQFREDRLPELIARKQRAALTSDFLLAAIPGSPGDGPRYLYTNRDKPLPRVLEGPPDPKADPEAWRLWNALQARFEGELPAIP